MVVHFLESEGVIVANLSGDYSTRDVYHTDYSSILRQVRTTPCPVIISLEGAEYFGREALASLEDFCRKIAIDLHQEIRLSNPSHSVRQCVEQNPFNMPVHDTINDALESLDDSDEF